LGHKYWKVKNPKIDYEQIINDLREEGVPEEQLHIASMIRQQTLLKAYLSRHITYCDIDDKHCDGVFCSICPRSD